MSENQSTSNQQSAPEQQESPAASAATPAPAAPSKPGKSGMAIAGLIVGIVALVLSALPIINNFAFILAILGLIFGIVGLVGTSKRKKSGLGIAIASVIISAVAAVVVLVSQATYSAVLDEAGSQLDRAAGNATEEVLGTDVDVQFGSFTMKKGSYGSIDSELPVKVTNLSDEQQSFTIQIEAVDANGDRIDTGYVYANNLGAGQSQTFKVFEYIPEDNYEAMKTASFNILSVGAM